MLRAICSVGIPIFATGVIWLFGVAFVQAEEMPSAGLLYNTKETHSMIYRCQQNRDNSLDCEFNQTSVRKKAKPEDLKSKLDQARKQFRGEAKISAEECTITNKLVDDLENRKKLLKEEGFKEMTDMQKKDLLKTSRGLVEFCKSRTEENFLNKVRLGHEKETRTCQVSSNAFKQSFRYVQDIISGTGAWVVQGTPEGPCGFVQLSRFEPDRLEGSKLVFWKYIARKAVTNPQGSFFLDVSCKGFDEGEYVYDWKSKEHSLGCDYVEFSPI